MSLARPFVRPPDSLLKTSPPSEPLASMRFVNGQSAGCLRTSDFGDISKHVVQEEVNMYIDVSRKIDQVRADIGLTDNHVQKPVRRSLWGQCQSELIDGLDRLTTKSELLMVISAALISSLAFCATWPRPDAFKSRVASVAPSSCIAWRIRINSFKQYEAHVPSCAP